MGTQEQTVEVTRAGHIELVFLNQEDMSVKISSDAEIAIDNIKLYNFIQSQKIYGVDNQELLAIAGIRQLNKALQEQFNE